MALVTGSTRGIGWAVARALAGAGAHVVVNGHRDAAEVERRVEELRAAGATATGVACDVADPADVRSCFQQLHREHRRLDILVNNAGILGDARIGMISEDALDRTLAVNTAGAIRILQAAARLMQRAGTGAIVNLTSIVGLRGNVGQSLYSASKSALVGLTLSAAKELGGSGIRVNAVAPGLIETDMIRHLDADVRARLEASIHLGRVGCADDVAEAVLFLVSDRARYITGQILGVDGGMVL